MTSNGTPEAVWRIKPLNEAQAATRTPLAMAPFIQDRVSPSANASDGIGFVSAPSSE